MICVIHKKQDFLKTLKYVLDKEKAEIIGTGMAGSSPDVLNEQFLAIAALNQSVVKKCAHIIVSIAAREKLSNSQYHQVTKEILQDLSYLPTQELSSSTSQFVAIRHYDRDHEHIHIVTSRVQHNGKSVSDSFDYFNAEVSTRRIADQLGLEIAPVSNHAIASRLKKEFGIIAEVSPEHQKNIKLIHNPRKKLTSKQIIRQAIEASIVNRPDISTFIERLETKGIMVLPKIESNNLLGLTYILGNVKIAGYQVYRPYSWAKLQSEYGLTYDYQKDSFFLEKTRMKALRAISNDATKHKSFSDCAITPNNLQKLELSIQPSVNFKTENSSEVTVENLPSQITHNLSTEAVSSLKVLPKKKQQSPPSDASLTTPKPTVVTSNLLETTEQTSQKLSSIIVNYMQVANRKLIEGRELRVELTQNKLQVSRIIDNTPVMQTNYFNNQWNEQLNILTTNQVRQIEHLKSLAQQKLRHKQTKNEKVTEM
ncbi:relaxase/mobilization nuclease domain-containing protein [Chlorogloea sp. CCALA 695]|uniref:relaxase/mobilization nuclease domain-containing protein n=1 Tax=Chlorogloea sp. CCALA 695 TaxID=2107693 RepID=UPI000D048F86|nr:relaxase/mobilization nuclease domain-containing protein [Chlorogloea sp. CCALA 695]PSB30828.1 hypothetical protein C7B70_15345 [Chlorogloea sp. CCALA 695]